ncbi:hypothetical protein [Sphingobacterium bambusae]|uniref:Uncharacterized protein n=1 Tax=Sphingobacterium bambusae TaxID=662858 RepID=A0ABW6BJF6_9SPHI|nr:hypothetical protein [Sphingobacterium bambusae]WPL49400.1 hypothetical protein SCB77_02900 [Sphingobacterium bambusae]
MKYIHRLFRGTIIRRQQKLNINDAINTNRPVPIPYIAVDNTAAKSRQPNAKYFIVRSLARDGFRKTVAPTGKYFDVL